MYHPFTLWPLKIMKMPVDQWIIFLDPLVQSPSWDLSFCWHTTPYVWCVPKQIVVSSFRYWTIWSTFDPHISSIWMAAKYGEIQFNFRNLWVPQKTSLSSTSLRYDKSYSVCLWSHENILQFESAVFISFFITKTGQTNLERSIFEVELQFENATFSSIVLKMVSNWSLVLEMGL